jgi:hypothetical protein
MIRCSRIQAAVKSAKVLQAGGSGAAEKQYARAMMEDKEDLPCRKCDRR